MSDRHDLKADPAQALAIRQGGGPCAVIAGPGSGKTFVLVERIRYLIDTIGVDPFSILVLTFSRAAAAQMRSRFFGMCGQQNLVFGTFHSVFYRILQESSPGRLSVIDQASKQKYLRHLCSTGLVPAGTTPEELQLLISRYKNGLPCRQAWIGGLVREYDLYLQNRGWLDFDDMVLRCKKRLEEDPAELGKWRRRFQWILVDEFQDVNPSQYDVLRLLAAPANNLFVVGDDDQSIYGFRGADPGTMRRFLEDHSLQRDPGRIVFLGTNYRCGRAVLQAAGALIRCNEDRIQKDFRAGSRERGCFRCRPFTGPEAEYAFIAQELEGMPAEEREETAVIFRTHFAAQRFLSLLRQKQIPFRAEGTSRREQGTETAEVSILQDLTAYYRTACALAGTGGFGGSGASRKDLLRIMNRPERYLSGSFAATEKMSRQQILNNAGVSRETVEDLVKDLALLTDLRPAFSMRYLFDAVGYRKYAAGAFRGAQEAEQDIQKRLPAFLDSILAQAKGYDSAAGWLSYMEDLLDLYAGGSFRGSGREKEAGSAAGPPRPEGAAAGCVHILTMHACKGLEFDSVFIPDLNEGTIPSKRAWSQGQVEEERRLLYVAMTRARRSLTLLYLEGTPDRPAEPSRFLQSFRIRGR